MQVVEIRNAELIRSLTEQAAAEMTATSEFVGGKPHIHAVMGLTGGLS